MTNKELYSIAKSARDASYSPYSKISVGAALLTGSGKVYTGANIENSAYSPSVCAERVAFFSAIHAGEREFVKIAVAGGPVHEDERKNFFPCGVCRQVMAEFCGDGFLVVLSEDCAIPFSDIFPHRFDEELVK